MAIAKHFIALGLLFGAGAASADERPYTKAAFEQLTGAGQEVVIDVHADWCPTCRRQQPVLEGLVKSDKFRGYTILVVDFDTQTEALRQFRVAHQSTLIVFHGAKERGRATGITEPQQISALLDQGL